MKNKLNIIIFILVVLCIIISVYLFFFSGGISNYQPTISLNQETIDLKIGEETAINPVITNLDDYTVLWTSSNESVVTVIDGKIRAINKFEFNDKKVNLDKKKERKDNNIKLLDTFKYNLTSKNNII